MEENYDSKILAIIEERPNISYNKLLEELSSREGRKIGSNRDDPLIRGTERLISEGKIIRYRIDLPRTGDKKLIERLAGEPESRLNLPTVE